MDQMKSVYAVLLGALTLAIVIGSLATHAAEKEQADAGTVQVAPQPDGSAVMLLDPVAVKYCLDNGGCRLVADADLSQAFRDLIAEAKKRCGPAI